MARLQKSTKLYAHPFCKDYWRDAMMEMKDTKMLVFAALIVALRVALKTIIRIPLGPSLDITPAFLANALGAMVYGPVVGALGAVVSDVLGVLLRGDTYFLPYVLTEISGTMIFAGPSITSPFRLSKSYSNAPIITGSVSSAQGVANRAIANSLPYEKIK